MLNKKEQKKLDADLLRVIAGEGKGKADRRTDKGTHAYATKAKDAAIASAFWQRYGYPDDYSDT
jgi:hypothetical protein